MDTNIWIDAIRRSNAHVVKRLQVTDAGELRLSTLVLGELLLGARKSMNASTRRTQFVHDLAKNYPCIEVDPATAEAYADIRQRLESEGKPIGPNDLWIAAQAAAYQLVLVTANTSEFRRVPSLTIENWREPAHPHG
nr:type II toxin-antitoxin system VapC family toxin [Corynebacterium aquatimens]